MRTHRMRAVQKPPYALNTITFISAVSMQESTTPVVSHTFTSVNLGPAYPGRRIVLVIGTTASSTTSGQISSVTVGGVSATQRSIYNGTGTNSIVTAIYDIIDTNNTTADITVTLGAAGTINSRIVHVYSLYSTATTVLSSSAATTPFEFTRTFVAGDVYIAGGRCLSTATETWSNATVNQATVETGRQRTSSASYAPAEAGSRTIKFTPSSTTSAWMVSAVYTS